MPHGLFIWTFDDIERFLKDRNFTLNYTNGSHYYYVGHTKGVYRQVCVPFHNRKSIKPRTMSGIILQSGIDKKEWINK